MPHETEDKNPWLERIAVELDPERMDQSLRVLTDKLRHYAEQGRYTRVRIKYKGKPIIPDVPLFALIAVEAATLWWAGPLRVLVVNLGVKTFVEIELVHAAGEKVQEAQALFLDGEVEQAEALYREALRIKPGDPSALFHLGVLLKVTGKKDQAKECFSAAAESEDHPDAERAAQALAKMG
jgi:tetratricopeptide (TPR) repeat protein